MTPPLFALSLRSRLHNTVKLCKTGLTIEASSQDSCTRIKLTPSAVTDAQSSSSLPIKDLIFTLRILRGCIFNSVGEVSILDSPGSPFSGHMRLKRSALRARLSLERGPLRLRRREPEIPGVLGCRATPKRGAASLSLCRTETPEKLRHSPQVS